MVIASLKAYQRVQALGAGALDRHRPPESRVRFCVRTRLARADGDRGSDRAPARGVAQLCRPGGLPGRPDRLGLVRLPHPRTRRPGDKAAEPPGPPANLKQLTGYAELFGRADFCDCENCRSVLGPAAYFVDLMGWVERHILDDSFKAVGGEDNSLHPRRRRPDLWTLELTCENTNRIVPTLDLVNPMLERFIVAREAAPVGGLALRAARQRRPFGPPALLDAPGTTVDLPQPPRHHPWIRRRDVPPASRGRGRPSPGQARHVVEDVRAGHGIQTRDRGVAADQGRGGVLRAVAGAPQPDALGDPWRDRDPSCGSGLRHVVRQGLGLPTCRGPPMSPRASSTATRPARRRPSSWIRHRHTGWGPERHRTGAEPHLGSPRPVRAAGAPLAPRPLDPAGARPLTRPPADAPAEPVDDLDGPMLDQLVRSWGCRTSSTWQSTSSAPSGTKFPCVRCGASARSSTGPSTRLGSCVRSRWPADTAVRQLEYPTCAPRRRVADHRQ